MIQHHFENDLLVRRLEAAAEARGTLLFIHGLGESGLCVEALIHDSRLAGWNRLVPDLPGYGRSPWPEQPLSLEEHAERLGHWLETRGGDPVVVVGHSMGGVIGLFLCERFPDQVRAFCNVEGNVSIQDCHFSSKVAAHSLEALLGGEFDRILDGIYEAGQKDLPLRGYYASLRLCDPRTYHRNSAELVAFSIREKAPARLAALSTPSTYILGSPGGTGDHSQSLLRAAGIEPQIIKNAGHWPFLDQPEAFVVALRTFLDHLD